MCSLNRVTSQPGNLPRQSGLSTDRCRMLRMRFLCGLSCCLFAVSFGEVRAQAPVEPPQLHLAEGHTKPIYAAQYAPDGKTVYTGSLDRTVKVWERATWKPLLTLGHHQNGVLAIAVSKDGRQLATSGLDRRILLYDAPIRDSIQNWSGFGGDITGLVQAADGSFFITADKSRLLRMWNPVNGQAIRDFQGVTAELLGVALSPDSQTVLALTADGFLRTWKTADGTLLGQTLLPAPTTLGTDPAAALAVTGGADGIIRVAQWPAALPVTLPGHSQPLTSLVANRSGAEILTGSPDQTVRRFQLSDGKEVLNYPEVGGPVHSVAGNADFSLVIAGLADGRIRVWDQTGKNPGTLSGTTGSVTALSIAEKTGTLASGGQDGLLRLWKGPPAPPTLMAAHSQPIMRVAVTQGGTLAVTVAADLQVLVHDLKAGKIRQQLKGLLQPPTSLSVSADGKLVAVGDQSGTVRIWTLADGAPAGEVYAHAVAVTGLAFLDAGRELASIGADGLVRQWALPLAPSTITATLPEQITSLALTPNGQQAVLASTDKSVRITDPTTGKEVRVMAPATAPVTALAVTPKGDQIFGGQNDGWLRSWTAADGKTQGEAYAHAGTVTSLVAHPKQPWVATAGQDGLIRLWNSPLRALRIDPKQGQTVTAVAISPDGKLHAIGSANNELTLRNATTGAVLHKLVGQQGAITALAFSKDQKSLASADATGMIAVWTTAQGQLTQRISAHTGHITGLSFHPTQPLLASTGADGAVRLWEVTNRLPAVLAAETSDFRAVTYFADGKQFLSARDNGTLQLWDSTKLTAAPEIVTKLASIRAVAVAANQAWAALGTEAGELRLMQLSDGKALADIAQPTPIHALSIHPQSQQLATVGPEGLVRLWQLPAFAPQALAGHKQAVNVISVSPNRQLIATAGAEPVIRLWNATTGAAVRTLEGHTAAVTGLAWSGDSAAILSGSLDKSARLWTVADGKQIHLFDQHGAEVRSVALTAAGDQVFTGGADNLIKQWAVADGKIVREIPGHSGAITGLVLSPNGAQLHSSSADASVRTWTVADGTAVRSLAHGQPVLSLAISPDGTLLASAGADAQIKLWQTSDGAAGKILAGHTGAVSSVQFSGDNQRLATASVDGTVRLWDVAGTALELVPSLGVPQQSVAFGADDRTVIRGAADGTLERRSTMLQRVLAGHTGAIHDVAFSPTGDRVYTAGADKTLRVWNPVDGVAGTQFAGATDALFALSVSGNGQFVAATGTDKKLRIWNASNGAVASEWDLPAIARSLALNADATRILTTNEDGATRLWDVTRKLELERSLGAASAGGRVAWAPDQKTFVTAGTGPGLNSTPVSAVRVWEAHIGPGGSGGVQFTADGTHLVTAGVDKFARLWNVNGEPVRQYAAGELGLSRVALNGDGSVLAAAASDNSILLWNAADGNPWAGKAKLPLPAGATALAFSADHKLLAVTSGDQRLRIFRVQDGQLWQDIPLTGVATTLAFATDHQSVLLGGLDESPRVVPIDVVQLFSGHEGAVHGVAFAPSGEQLVSGGLDKTIRTWNLVDGQLLRAVAGQSDVIHQLAISPDGLTLFTTAADKTLKSWKMTDGSAIATFTHPAAVRGCVVSPDNTLAATTCDDNYIRIWDLVTGKELQHYTGHQAVPAHIVWNAQGTGLLTASSDKTLRFWPRAAVRVVPAHPLRGTALAATPDQQQFVTMGDDKIAKLWDRKGQLVQQFGGSSSVLRSLTVRGDSLQLAGANDEQGADKGLYLWDLKTGMLTARVETPAAITGVAYRADHQQIAISQTDQFLRSYTLHTTPLLQEALPLPAVATTLDYGATGQLVAGLANQQLASVPLSGWQTIAAHTGPVQSVVWMDAGNYCVTSGADLRVALWHAPTGTLCQEFTGATEIVSQLAIAPDGQTLAAGSVDKHVRFYPLMLPAKVPAAPAKIAPTATWEHPAAVRSVAYSRSGKRLATGCDDSLVHVWDVATGRELERAAGHTNTVSRVAFGADERTLVSAAADNTTKAWKLSVERSEAVSKAAILAITCLPESSQLVVATAAPAAAVWPITLEKVGVALAGVGLPLQAVAVDPSGKRIYGGDTQQWRIWNAADGTVLFAQPVAAPVTAIGLAEAGQRVLIGGLDGSLHSWGLQTTEKKLSATLLQEHVGHTAAVTALLPATDGRTVLSASNDRGWRRWPSTGTAPRAVLTGHSAPVYALEFSPDGKLLASASGDKTARLWDTIAATQAQVCEGHTGQVFSVAFHPQGTQIATAGTDKVLRVWKTDGTIVKEMPLPAEEGLYSVQFYADGNWLLTGGLSRTWQAWNVSEGKVHRTALGHTDHLLRAVFHPNYQRVASVDYSGHLIVWDFGSANAMHRQQLPVPAAYTIAYAPDGREVIVGGQDNRLMVIQVPPNAR